MSNVFYLILRRLRVPLIALIGIYTICVIGMSLVPGVDAEGNPTEGLTLFESFYVMSYVGTTIGLGELPVPYSAAQRLWLTLSIYLGVMGWTYAMLSIISLLQDSRFQNVMHASRFASKVRSMREPFYIICGCGETGILVCRGLDRLNYRFVVIEQDESRLEELGIEEFHHDPPMTIADAAQASVLVNAGLMKPNCRGVMALAERDETNRAIAVAVRLLNPSCPVLSRVRDSDENDVRSTSFGGDAVINPFQRFAEYLDEAIATPEAYRLRATLTGLPGEPMPEPQRPPRGRWLVCGYGRFGKAIVDRLHRSGMSVSVIDNLHWGAEAVDVEGSGTDPDSLRSAGIERAAGIVAGNASDLKNLAIAVTARDLKPDIFIVTRQNQAGNDLLFDSFEGDLAMVPSKIVAREFLVLITTPLVLRFLRSISDHSEQWCAALLNDIEMITRGRIPEIWSLNINLASSAPVCRRMQTGMAIRVGDLMRDAADRNHRLPIKVLMLVRGRDTIELPPDSMEIRVGDHLLLASTVVEMNQVKANVQNLNTFSYLVSGKDVSAGWVWRQFVRSIPQMDPELPQPDFLGRPYDFVDDSNDTTFDVAEVEEEPEIEWRPLSDPEDEEAGVDAVEEPLEVDATVGGVEWEPFDPEADPAEIIPVVMVEDVDDDAYPTLTAVPGETTPDGVSDGDDSDLAVTPAATPNAASMVQISPAEADSSGISGDDGSTPSPQSDSPGTGI